MYDTDEKPLINKKKYFDLHDTNNKRIEFDDRMKLIHWLSR